MITESEMNIKVAHESMDVVVSVRSDLPRRCVPRDPCRSIHHIYGLQTKGIGISNQDILHAHCEGTRMG